MFVFCWARSSVVENIYQTITTRRILSTGRRLFVKIRKWAGVYGRIFHDLRRSAMSAMENSGATNTEIASFSGHNPASPVLGVYVRPDKETARNSATKRWGNPRE